MKWEEERARIEDDKDRSMMNMFSQILERLAPPAPSIGMQYHDSFYQFPED